MGLGEDLGPNKPVGRFGTNNEICECSLGLKYTRDMELPHHVIGKCREVLANFFSMVCALGARSRQNNQGRTVGLEGLAGLKGLEG